MPPICGGKMRYDLEAGKPQSTPGARPRAQIPELEGRRTRPLTHYLWLSRTPKSISPVSGPEIRWPRSQWAHLWSLSPRNKWPWRASFSTPTAPRPAAQALALTWPSSLPYANSLAIVRPRTLTVGRGTHTHTHSLIFRLLATP